MAEKMQALKGFYSSVSSQCSDVLFCSTNHALALGGDSITAPFRSAFVQLHYSNGTYRTSDNLRILCCCCLVVTTAMKNSFYYSISQQKMSRQLDITVDVL